MVRPPEEKDRPDARRVSEFGQLKKMFDRPVAVGAAATAELEDHPRPQRETHFHQTPVQSDPVFLGNHVNHSHLGSRHSGLGSHAHRLDREMGPPQPGIIDIPRAKPGHVRPPRQPDRSVRRQ